jgi:hypothetical protein
MVRKILALGATAIAAVALSGAAATPVAAADNPLTSYGPFTYSMSPVGDTSQDVWTCSGFRLDAGAALQDHFTCTVSNQTFTGTFSESSPWPCGCSGWASDFDGQVAKSYVIRVSGNGLVVGSAKY